MKPLLIFAAMLCVIQASLAQSLPVRERVNFDSDWRFTKGDAPGTTLDRQALVQACLPTAAPFGHSPPGNGQPTNPEFGWLLPYTYPDFDDGAWTHVDLPHDWAIAGPFTHGGGGGMGRLPTAGVGWYRKSFEIPKSDAKKDVFLDIDGSMSYAAVWLNGKFVGGWPYGYASWRVDLTPYLHVGGRNQLAIRLDNLENSSRWYPGAGIYRHMWLVTTSPIHVAHWGSWVNTRDVSKASAEVDLNIDVANDSAKPATVQVQAQIYAVDLKGRRASRPSVTIPAKELQIDAGKEAPATGLVVIQNPNLWGPPPLQKPHRYVAVTTVTSEGKIVDRYETKFGIRSIQFTANDGLLVNGRRVNLQGVCMHHDLGALGAALNDRALHRQLDMLVEMGTNAIRTSHNPPAPELLEYADEHGLLVMDEFADVWQAQKTPNDYHLLFDDWHEQDLRALIDRDRNHPSVVMWSIGNEVGEQFRGEAGARTGEMLTAIAHDEDPTRPTTTAMNAARANSPFPAAVDLIGLNYQGTGVRNGPAQYPVFHQQYPGKFVYGSETTAAVSSRGEYTFPVGPSLGVPASANAGEDTARHQVSSYDVYTAPWSYSPDHEFMSQDRWPFVGGEFVWTGWDYLGEPTPFDTSRSSYFGIIDLAGFKKDRFYLYQARWRPNLPMAHILPHWTWPERVGLPTPVHVYTSGDEGELFLNGRSLGRRKKAQYEYRLRWDEVIYEPGTLKVVTYKNGKVWATDEVSTAGAPSRVSLSADRNSVAADGTDLVFITATIRDARGQMVPQAHSRITFSVEGPGEIVATDNGDPTNFESFASPSREAFNGLALVIVRSRRGKAGEIRVRASADGLEDGGLLVRASLHGLAH